MDKKNIMKTLTDDIEDDNGKSSNNNDDDKDEHKNDKVDVDNNLFKDNSLINKIHSMNKGQLKQMLPQQPLPTPSPSPSPSTSLTYPLGIQSQPKQLSSLQTTVKGTNLNYKQEQQSSTNNTSNTQRVYKKASPNSLLTLYLPTREISLTSTNKSALLSGIVHIEPEVIQNSRLYVQLTLTFRYGREDEEVMGLRFSNEAIMSIAQLWPRQQTTANNSLLTPLQEALSKRLGRESLPFTLSLNTQAPPSVQLVPAKRYYGSPIGTSYDVRCFIVDQNNETIERNTSVRMGVRVIYRTDILGLNNTSSGNFMLPESFSNLLTEEERQRNSPVGLNLSSPFDTEEVTDSNATSPRASSTVPTTPTATITPANIELVSGQNTEGQTKTDSEETCIKVQKAEREELFGRLRLSPKTFRFSGRFGRSKSEAEKHESSSSTYNYKNRNFAELESRSSNILSGKGPQASVEKPFLLQDGRVILQASLDKAWYTHGEVILVNIHIRNDSRKTVRKVRVCAIQHVDVCMFNNGKFKNVVAESDIQSPFDRVVSPGATFNGTVTLTPERGTTKNWIALEDSLQRSTEPAEITGAIAASAIRTPHQFAGLFCTNQPNTGFIYPNTSLSPNAGGSSAVPVSGFSADSGIGSSSPGTTSAGIGGNVGGSNTNEKNVFAIYVTYYVKVKLSLSAMGGDLTLKLPFVLIHVNEQKTNSMHDRLIKLTLDEVPASKKKNPQQQQTNLQNQTNLKVSPNIRPINTVLTTEPQSSSSPAVTNSQATIPIGKRYLRKAFLPRSSTATDHLSQVTTEENPKDLSRNNDSVSLPQVSLHGSSSA